MNKPILYTITSCSRCQKAKHHLESIDMEYIERNILEDFQSIQGLMKISGEIITPTLVIGKKTYKQREILSIQQNSEKKCY